MSEKPAEQPNKTVSENALETRVKALEEENLNLKINQRIIEIHSAWADFKHENKNTDFLDGVLYAVKNYKAVAKNSVAQIPPADATRIGVKVIDEDELNKNSGGQMK